MKKYFPYFPIAAGIVLGLMFVMSGIVVLFNLVSMPPPPVGSAAATFMQAFVPTGYMNFVKVLEILGGILVAIPRTRNWGLLILGPILVNILAYHVFVSGPKELLSPGLLVIVALALYLLWTGRRAFAGLLNQRSPVH